MNSRCHSEVVFLFIFFSPAFRFFFVKKGTTSLFFSSSFTGEAKDRKQFCQHSRVIRSISVEEFNRKRSMSILKPSVRTGASLSPSFPDDPKAAEMSPTRQSSVPTFRMNREAPAAASPCGSYGSSNKFAEEDGGESRFSFIGAAPGTQTQTDFSDDLFEQLLREEAIRLENHSCAATQKDLPEHEVWAAGLEEQKRKEFLGKKKVILGRSEPIIKTLRDRVGWAKNPKKNLLLLPGEALQRRSRLEPLHGLSGAVALYERRAHRPREVVLLHNANKLGVHRQVNDQANAEAGGEQRLLAPQQSSQCPESSRSAGVESLDWQGAIPKAVVTAGGSQPTISRDNQQLVSRLFHRPKDAATLPLDDVFLLEKVLADEVIAAHAQHLKQVARGKV
jgi:hypothetical protein